MKLLFNERSLFEFELFFITFIFFVFEGLDICILLLIGINQ